MKCGERIAELRKRCLERKGRVRWLGSPVAAAASLSASEHIESRQVRRGLLTRDLLAAVQFEVDDLELLMGRLAPAAEEPSDELAAAERYLAEFTCRTGGQTGHCELDRSRVLSVGIDGVREEIRGLLAAAAGKPAETYQSFIYALDGLSAMIENAAATARAAMACSGGSRADELRAMAESCGRIAHEPPESFRDALQLVYFMDSAPTIAENVGLVVPGHIDRTLLPFYEADIAAGRIDDADALALVESLYLLINEFVPDGLAISVMVGGRDAAGNDLTNGLSYICLEAIRRTRLIYPTVGVCWHDDTPRELVALAVELIGLGHANVALFGDETIQRGLRDLGLPAEQACNYINSTCVEITPAGMSNVWVASPYYSVCAVLLEEIAAQVEECAPADTFDEFLRRYRKRLAEHITAGVAEQNRLRVQRRDYGGKPLQSVFTRDCIERGADIDSGGAACNWIECSFVGMANLADSLHVIRRVVYDEQSMTPAGMKALLDSNFEGDEQTRLAFLHKHAKYGNDCREVDDLMRTLTAMVRDECARHRVEPGGSAFVPGMFCWIMHDILGRECGATPDGRRAGFPFADGAGPAQGRERNGPTAAVISTTSWDHAPMIGGIACNMKFARSMFGSAAAFERLRDLVLTFLRRGGFEMQINVLDSELLERARENPEQYQDLVVRIGGYTDYFTRLSPSMQEEVIMRTSYGEM